MKKRHLQLRRTGAFTLVELMVASAVAVLTGAIVYQVLNMGLVLFAKNIALNAAHQEARSSILRMQYGLHSSASVPYLIDFNFVQGSGMIALGGIAFQTYAWGPGKVAANATSSATVIRVQLPAGAKPAKGQKLILPAHQIEQSIKTVTPVTGNSTQFDITVKDPIGKAVTVVSGINNYNVVCFITDGVCYLVYNGTLYYYPNFTDAQPRILTTGITSAAPFSTPKTPLGAPFNRFVAAINLSTADTSSTNRGYKASNIFLHSEIPFRARLTTYQ